VKLVVELGFPELTTEQIETLCSTAENAARKYILSKVSNKDIDRLDISVEADGSKPVKVTVEIDLILASQTKNVDAEALVKEAVNEAHEATENFLRKIK
jgi:predicted S18 family serine protease